tara:strand:+ start:140 stop:550 length:411 start_codon:yes stop_codon:yes gene_type:complete
MSLAIKTMDRNFSGIFDSLFDDIWSTPTVRSTAIINKPKVYVDECENKYTLALSAPGVEKNDFNVTLSEGFITLEYTKNKEQNNRHFDFASFKRKWTVPKSTKASDISASYDKGVFTVEVKKVQPTSPKVDIIKIM